MNRRVHWTKNFGGAIARECQVPEYPFQISSFLPYCPVYCPTFDFHLRTMVFGLCHGTRQHLKASQSRWQMDLAIDSQEEIWALRLGCLARRRLLRRVARGRAPSASASGQHRRASNGGTA